MFYLWNTHVMSTGSLSVKALTCRHLQCYSSCRLLNRITVDKLPLSEGRPFRPHVGRPTELEKSCKSDAGVVLP